jgi:hypothetical protein
MPNPVPESVTDRPTAVELFARPGSLLSHTDLRTLGWQLRAVTGGVIGCSTPLSRVAQPRDCLQLCELRLVAQRS